MRYPDRETYGKLYARYTAENGRSVNELLDLAGDDFTGMRVLDLCGGGGEMAKAAFARNAEYVLLQDGTEEMFGERDENIDYTVREVGFFLEDPWYKEDGHRFDVVLCRQAVNYWLDEEMAEELASIMEPGGTFVFNTFNKKPSLRPKVKKYKFHGIEYVEMSWLDCFDNMVHHVQCREGMAPHTTSFKWISPFQFQEWLQPYFEVERKTDGAATLYCCKKK